MSSTAPERILLMQAAGALSRAIAILRPCMPAESVGRILSTAMRLPQPPHPREALQAIEGVRDRLTAALTEPPAGYGAALALAMRDSCAAWHDSEADHLTRIAAIWAKSPSDDGRAHDNRQRAAGHRRYAIILRGRPVPIPDGRDDVAALIAEGRRLALREFAAQLEAESEARVHEGWRHDKETGVWEPPNEDAESLESEAAELVARIRKAAEDVK